MKKDGTQVDYISIVYIMLQVNQCYKIFIIGN